MGCRHDLYFMLHLPATVAQAIVRLRARLDTGYRGPSWPMATERLHVTLVPLGSYAPSVPPAVLQLALSAGSWIEREPFRVSFDTLQSLGSATGEGSVELAGHGDGVLPLFRLRRQLAESLRHVGWPDQLIRPKFRPHVTLDYRHRPIGVHHIEPLAWQVTEFLLIDSRHGEGRHEVLTRWALLDRQGSLFD